VCYVYSGKSAVVFTMWFDSDGSLQFETEAVDADAMYDEIGGALRIKQYQEVKKGAAGIPGAVLPCLLPR